jgi:hypothetical protein
MTKEDNRSLVQKWNEFWGRKIVMDPIPFTETALLTQPVPINVGYLGYYLRLPPNTAAIIRSATDQTYVYTEGGHQRLQEGGYTLQYIDMSERFYTFPRISAPALDSNEVSLIISIFYKVNDPVLIKNNPTPLKALFSVCEGALKNFIVTHRYDQLIGEIDNQEFIADPYIAQHIKEQVAFKDACRAFWLKDVIIEERLGSYELARKKQDRIVQEKQSQIQREGVTQQRGIAEEQKELERIRAEKDVMVKEMQALFEANKTDILRQAKLFEVELELMRKQPELHQAQFLKIIDSKKHAVDALLQLFSISGFPRDENDLQLIDKILTTLTETQRSTPQLPPERSKSMNELNSTIINLIAPKK